MCNWITLLCTWNMVSQLHYNKIYILKKRGYHKREPHQVTQNPRDNPGSLQPYWIRRPIEGQRHNNRGISRSGVWPHYHPRDEKGGASKPSHKWASFTPRVLQRARESGHELFRVTEVGISDGNGNNRYSLYQSQLVRITHKPLVVPGCSIFLYKFIAAKVGCCQASWKDKI